MSIIFEEIRCTHCNSIIDVKLDTIEKRLACPNCKSTVRATKMVITETLNIYSGSERKSKRSGKKKPFIEDKSTPSYSHSRQKIVHHERVIDRDNDHYCEIVTDYESGEIIHSCDEPLSKHINHGSAKRYRLNDFASN